MTHEIKIEHAYYESVLCGDKTFEIRFNDRGYQKGEMVVLKEYINSCYTGREIEAEITYVTGYMQKENYVVFGIKILCAK